MLSHLFTYLLIANIIVSLDLHIESSGDWKSRRKYQIHALRMQSINSKADHGKRYLPHITSIPRTTTVS